MLVSSHGLTIVLAATAALTAPRRDTTSGEAAPARQVTIVATDFRFAMPDTLTAGPTVMRVENRGRELHHVTLVRLTQGKTAADLVRAMTAGGPPPMWAVEVGGPNAADPGTTSLATTVRLLPGRYAAICVIPSPDGVPHVMKGMARDFVVVPGAAPVSLDAPADATVELLDYGFRASVPITSLTRSIRVINLARQPHELVLVALAPGKTLGDIATWVEKMDGPPPARFLGGVSTIDPGEENELALSLAPGHYAMLCFVPDAKDGKPHVAHGMMHDFEVR